MAVREYPADVRSDLAYPRNFRFSIGMDVDWNGAEQQAERAASGDKAKLSTVSVKSSDASRKRKLDEADAKSASAGQPKKVRRGKKKDHS